MPDDRALVLDTSVVVKWFRQGEVLADRALAVRDAYLRGATAVIVPDLLVYELANVLRYKAGLSTEQVCAGVQSLYDLGLDWVAPSPDVMGRAVQIARAHDTTVYDATFVALAESLGVTVVTADARLAQRLAALPCVRFLGDVAS